MSEVHLVGMIFAYIGGLALRIKRYLATRRKRIHTAKEEDLNL